MEKIGLFLSDDELSKYAFNKLSGKFKIFPFSFSSISSIPSKTVKIEKFEDIVDFFIKNNIRKIVLIGKVPQSIVFKKMDNSWERLLGGMERLCGEEILKKFADYLKKIGIEILSLDKVFKEDIAEEKIYTERKPTEREMEDIRIGFEIGMFLTKYRIGQSLSIKRGVIIAVEGIEGTDKMIERSGKYCKDFVVVKVAGEDKDKRFDLPVIGPETIKNIWKANGRVIAVEAEKSIIFEKELTVSLCNKYGISLVGKKFKK